MTTTNTASQVEATQPTLNAIELLCKFVNQRAGLCFADYGDRTIYMRESREITKDRADFYEFLNLGYRLCDDLNERLIKYLTNTGDRLTLENNKLKYITGQYFPTEYRPAATRAIKSIIWDSIREEKDTNGNFIYNTGDEIRAVFKRNLSRRAYKNYFN